MNVMYIISLNQNINNSLIKMVKEKLTEIQEYINKYRKKCKLLKKCKYCFNCKEKCWIYDVNLILNPTMYDSNINPWT